MAQSAPSSDRANTLRVFLTLLLAADAAFIAIHFVHIGTPYLESVMYSIEADGGFAEWFQYVKEFWVALLAALLWRRTGSLYFAGWMLLYGYLLCDDSFSVHEMAGEIASRHLGFGPALGLRAVDFGELLVNGLVGLGFLVLIGSGYLKSDDNAKRVSRDLTLLLVVLIVCGVALDTMHSMITSMPIRYTMGLIEDGGEMLTMSVTCWYVFSLVDRDGRAPSPTLVERARALVGRSRR